MSATHYAGLFFGYAIGLVAMFVIARQAPHIWPVRPAPRFERPWREVGWAFVAAAGVLAIGMLYSRGWLLPATSRGRPLLDAVNQLLIYGPFLLLLAWRRHGLETAWLPTRNIPLRIGTGLALALLALATYAVVRFGIGAWPSLVAHVYSPRHFSYFVQVLLEDISIAILFVRVRSVLGLPWTLIVVAVLFAAAHIPGLLASGAVATDLLHLFGDVALGILGLALLQRLQDVWWFWGVHFALDMTQFYGAVA